MTDGGPACLELILERIENLSKLVERNASDAHEYRQDMKEQVREIRESVHKHQNDVDDKFDKMNVRVDEFDGDLKSVLTDRAKITGAVKALSLLWAALAAIVAFAPGLVRDVVNGALNK